MYLKLYNIIYCCVRYAEEVVSSARYTTLITLCICGIESVFGGVIFIGVSILQSFLLLLRNKLRNNLAINTVIAATVYREISISYRVCNYSISSIYVRVASRLFNGCSKF